MCDVAFQMLLDLCLNMGFPALKVLTDNLTRKRPLLPLLSTLKLKGAFLIFSSQYIYVCIISVLTEIGLRAVERAVR